LLDGRKESDVSQSYFDERLYDETIIGIRRGGKGALVLPDFLI